MSLLKFLFLLLIVFIVYLIGQGIGLIFSWLQNTKIFSWLTKLWRFLPRLPRKIVTNLLKMWHSLPRFYHNLAANLVLGLLLTWLLLEVFHSYPILIDPEDEGMDLAMQILEQNIPPMADKNIPPFVFLDIDDKTHQAWGEPLFTPRNRLKNLIDAAVKAEARLIVVDVGLSQKTPIDGLGLMQHLHPYDQQLSDYLANYAASCEKDKMTCPPIILSRTFRATLPKPQSVTDTGYFSVPSLPIPEERSSFFDPAVAHSMPYVQWASSAFFRSSDYVIRRWWLWQPTCTSQQPGVIPSIELLAAALIRNEKPQENQELLTNALNRFKPKKCPGHYVPPQPEPIQIGQLTVSTDTYSIRQRIMYSMPWLVNDQPPLLPHSLCAKGNHCEPPILTILSAQRYAESPPTADLNTLKNRIVVIGGSYSDGRDIHVTPLGNMPGPLILINAIHSLLQYEKIESVSIGQKLLLQAGLIILISIISILLVRNRWMPWTLQRAIHRFGYTALFMFGIFWGTFSGTIVILILLPLTISLLRYGIWLDFVIPLLLVQLNQTMNDFNDFFTQCYNNLWFGHSKTGF